jgi:hypothetical protein
MNHDWVCISPGEYDFLYECRRCKKRHVESIDNPDSALPKDGRCEVTVLYGFNCAGKIIPHVTLPNINA